MKKNIIFALFSAFMVIDDKGNVCDFELVKGANK